MGVLAIFKNLFNKKDHHQQQQEQSSLKRSSSTTHDSKKMTTSFASKKGSISNNSNPTVLNNGSHHSSSVNNSPSESTSKQFTSSSGHSYSYRDGRRYHADESVAYVLPNDDDEADRVHQQHWILRYALQGNFFAPVTKRLEEGINVLDSGCGPATWAFEMGETFPRSKFYGIDASCSFPEEIKPANVEFVIGNIAKEIPYEENYFDFIHQRLLILGLTDEDWTNALSNLYKVLKPGGYIELSEPDHREMKEAGPAMNLMQTTLREMTTSRGLPAHIATELKDRLIKAGFVDVVVKSTPIPLNQDDKISQLLWADFKHAYTNIRPVMAKANPAWEDSEAYKVHIDRCSKEVRQSRTCVHWQNVYARKPEQSSKEQQAVDTIDTTTTTAEAEANKNEQE